MAIDADTLDILEQRREQIMKAMAALDTQRAELTAELDEIADLRERVGRMVERIAGGAGSAKTMSAARRKNSTVSRGRRAVPAARAETSKAKPDSLPTMPAMILAALRDGSDGKGLTPKGIRDVIAAASWPQVSIDAVGPIAWRMWKRGQLSKDGDRYIVPR